MAVGRPEDANRLDASWADDSPVDAIQAVTALQRRGLRAVRAEDGVPEWRAAGLPIEGGAS